MVADWLDSDSLFEWLTMATPDRFQVHKRPKDDSSDDEAADTNSLSVSILSAHGNLVLKSDQLQGGAAVKLKEQIIREDRLVHGYCREMEAAASLFLHVSRDIIDCIFGHHLLPQMEMFTMGTGTMDIIELAECLYGFGFDPRSSFPSARSRVSVKNVPGRYYYEYEVTSLAKHGNNLAQIGWCDDECSVRSVQLRGIGDCTHSWAFDGGRVRKWHNAEWEKQRYGKKWAVGDVVGCAIHLYGDEAQTLDFGFYLNGEYLGDAWTKCSFSAHLYPACTFQLGYSLGHMVFSRDDLKFLPDDHEPILF